MLCCAVLWCCGVLCCAGLSWLAFRCFDVFWRVLVCFNVFWCVLMCFRMFWCVLVCCFCLCFCLFVFLRCFGSFVFLVSALRVFRAVTRLTVYRALSIWDIFGSDFRRLFNFVFQFSQNLFVRIWLASFGFCVLSCSRSGYSQIWIYAKRAVNRQPGYRAEDS